MLVYYNDNDPYAVRWLQNLIAAGYLSNGVVDDRDLRALAPNETSGFGRAHFFAGIGGWELALELAGWPPDRPVWTGSCPCQPFSVSGKRKGNTDDRHLWPFWFEHIRSLAPPTIFGEQVASAAGRGWLAGVFADLETLGYAVAGADLCAAGVGAPHIRQRLFWVACTRGGSEGNGGLQRRREYRQQQKNGGVGGVALSGPLRAGRSVQQSGQGAGAASERSSDQPGGSGGLGGLGHPDDPGLQRRRVHAGERPDQLAAWSPSEFIHCADGKTRRTQSGLFPLAHGVSARVGKLRGYGNAIVPQLGALFIQAFLDAEEALTDAGADREASG